MKLALLNFRGHFEETEEDVAEHLQILEPENPLEQTLLAWAILPQGETIEDDPNRPSHTFHYQLGEHIERGLYQLHITTRTPKGQWSVEVAAGLVSVGAATAGERDAFAPFWFLSHHLRFKTHDERVRSAYSGDAFGRLDFGADARLPHRRLFRAVAA